MAWLELHQSLPTHRKTLAMADALDVQPAHIVGHIACLWLWALDNAQDGVLQVSPRLVARAAQWEGDPQAFMDALLAAGFLDHDGRIHDWDEYAGRLLKQRKLTSEWHRARRQMLPIVLDRDGYICQICGEPVLPEELSLDHVYPKSRGGAHTKENLRVVHRCCNSRKGARV
jgi:hypothetical protein